MRKNANFIYNATKIIHGTVNELLDKGLLEKNRITPKLSEVSLVSMVKDTINIMKTQIAHRKMRIKYAGSTSTRLFVKIDECRVQQILFNLISNAMKFSPVKSQITVSLKVN